MRQIIKIFDDTIKINLGRLIDIVGSLFDCDFSVQKSRLYGGNIDEEYYRIALETDCICFSKNC